MSQNKKKKKKKNTSTSCLILDSTVLYFCDFHNTLTHSCFSASLCLHLCWISLIRLTFSFSWFLVLKSAKRIETITQVCKSPSLFLFWVHIISRFISFKIRWQVCNYSKRLSSSKWITPVVTGYMYIYSGKRFLSPL